MHSIHLTLGMVPTMELFSVDTARHAGSSARLSPIPRCWLPVPHQPLEETPPWALLA